MSKLCVDKLCVSKLCEQVVCEQVVCEQVVCVQVVCTSSCVTTCMLTRCVWTSCVWTSRSGGEAEVQNQKQEPHTKMWGKTCPSVALHVFPNAQAKVWHPCIWPCRRACLAVFMDEP